MSLFDRLTWQRNPDLFVLDGWQLDLGRVTIMPDIVVVERGPADAAQVPGFTLAGYTTRRK